MVNLSGHVSADRILSDSFSEDWPELHLDLARKAPGGMHRGAGSQLIYNRESKQSLFCGALTLTGSSRPPCELRAAGAENEDRIV